MHDPDYLHLVVDAAPIAIVVADAAGTITLVNAQGERLFGYDRGELVGRAFEDLVPARFRGGHPDLREGYLRAPESRPMGAGRDLFGLRKDGSEVPVEIGFNPIATSAGSFTLAAVIEITERKRAEEHLRSVIEASPTAMLMVDRAGSITLVNAQTERLFGYPREELLGTPVERLVPERFRGGHGALRAGFHARPSTRSMGAGRDLFGLRRDGTEVPIEIGLNPLSTPEGEFVLASVIDIAERKHAEDMRLQRDRAVDASQLKSQFVATMSHELRTPLNAIIGTAELLSATALDPRQRGLVETVDRSAEALLSVISSILDFSKIEAGKVDLEMHDFDVESVVASAAAMLGAQAREKGLALHTFVDPELPASLRGDADRLRQILLNLIGNAVKFTHHGRIVVRAVPGESVGRSLSVRFEVHDTGIGISRTTLARLFEPFVQADGSSSRTYGGTGLGLSICKRLVELMDGGIGAVSEPGGGSLFWFTARLGRSSTADVSRRIEGLRALVVSADDVFCDIVSRYVTLWGMPARCARDVAAAIDAVRASPASDGGAAPWIAIVDVDSAPPDMNALQQAGIAPDRIVRIGRNEALANPIRPSLLFDRIAGIGGGGVREKAAPPAPASSGPRGTVLVVEDNANLREILAQQFAHLGISANLVADGAEAVEAIRNQDVALVFMDVHMPNIDGFSATRMIREAEAGTARRVPIVAMTANAFKEDREACLAAGMDDYLSKPVRLDDLRTMARRWIGAEPRGRTVS